ncbi:MAG: hypothetical protein M5R36_09130 [Deltaproteobacteria bacterium]|nr:hypothetical protein [Deltaproteobacteria bacterium]
MSGYGGFIFSIIEGERASRLEEIIEESFSFTDTVSSVDLKPKTLEICFISLDGQSFSYAALARRGQKVATLKFRLRFTDLVDLDHLPISDIEADIGPRFKSHFASASGGLGGRVPQGLGMLLSTALNDLLRMQPPIWFVSRKKRLEERRPFRTNSPERMAMEKGRSGIVSGNFRHGSGRCFSNMEFLRGRIARTLFSRIVQLHSSRRPNHFSRQPAVWRLVAS